MSGSRYRHNKATLSQCVWLSSVAKKDPIILSFISLWKRPKK